MWGHVLNTILGVWLMAAPGVLGYEGIARDHDHIVGPVVATFACVAIWEATRPLRWVTFVGGLWMLAAPWLLSFPSDATINAMVVGIAVALLSLTGRKITHSFGGGWSALWRGGGAQTAAAATPSSSALPPRAVG